MLDNFIHVEYFSDWCTQYYYPAEHYFFYVLSIALALLLGYLTYKKAGKSKTSIWIRLIFSIFVSAVSWIFISIFLILFFFVINFVIVGCTIENRFWTPINAGHELHALIKRDLEITGTAPKNLEDLRNRRPELISKIEKSAKIAYEYNEDTKEYVLFIRSSKNSLVLFHPKIDFRFYNLTDQDKQNYEYKYPPDFSGPWDKLPE